MWCDIVHARGIEVCVLCVSRAPLAPLAFGARFSRAVFRFVHFIFDFVCREAHRYAGAGFPDPLVPDGRPRATGTYVRGVDPQKGLANQC